MAPGQRLVEEELAGLLAVTRASLRAALFDLTAEELVERIPNRGARVRAVTLDEAVAITECRMALEGLCAAKAAGRVAEPQAARLRQLGEEMERSVADGEPLKYSALNHAAPADQGDLGAAGRGGPARAAERATGPASVPAVVAPGPPPGLAARASGDDLGHNRAAAGRSRGGHPAPPAQRHHRPA